MTGNRFCFLGGWGVRSDPSTSVHQLSRKALEKHSLVANVLVMDWLSQALAHPFRRYSFLALQSTIVPKVHRPWSKRETESNRLQSDRLH